MANAMKANVCQLENKSCLVTGAASGFGSLLALQLAVEKNARVALVDRNEKLGLEVLARIHDLLGKKGIGAAEAKKRAIFIQADLSDMDDVEKAYRETIAAFGTLDVAVNNAGVSDNESFVDGPNPRSFSKMLDINLRAVMLGTKLAIDEFNRNGKGGAIVNTASLAGLLEVYRLAAYATAKAGVVHLARCLRPLAASRGIRVNAICPGAVMTPLVLHALRDPEMKKFSYPEESEKDVRGRSVPPEMIAQAMMMAIEDTTLGGDVIQINPRGIAVIDSKAKRPPPLPRKWDLDWSLIGRVDDSKL